MTDRYPTISISLTEDRLSKITKILRALRNEDESISRSEAIGRAVDHFFLVVCPIDMTSELSDHRPVDIPA